MLAAALGKSPEDFSIKKKPLTPRSGQPSNPGPNGGLGLHYSQINSTDAVGLIMEK